MKTTTNKSNANGPERTGAEAFHPGEYLRDELDARGWSQVEFSDIVGRPPRVINEIIAGKRGITAETAKALAAALGTSPELWMNLDSAYQLGKSAPVPSEVAERAVLRGKFPVRDLINRRWIQFSDNETLDILKDRLLEYYEINEINEPPRFAAAFKNSGNAEEPTLNQVAWIYRVKHIAETVHVPPYSERSLRNALSQLAALKTAPEAARHVPQILANCGVRFVIVEPLPSSKVDGVCLWLDSSPVIGLALRFDRIDNFWFLLRHEIEHLLNGDGKDSAMVDTDVEAPPAPRKGQSDEENKANLAAADFCVPQKELKDFLARNQALLYRKAVLEFAYRLRIHPGIVAGQIQRQLSRYDLFRPMLVPVRKIITETAMTDGYGHVIATQG